ncbi:MAG: hypothetical protein ACE5PT_03540 [Gemmatimonadales bacterium]
MIGSVAALLFTTACEFGQVAIPEGEPIIVVIGVMRPELRQQWIVVERTLTGAEAAEDSLEGRVPGSRLQLAVEGATVTVANRSYPADPCGTVTFVESAAPDDSLRAPGVYWSPLDCPTMRTGDMLELRVLTPAGDLVVGTTEIPGSDEMILETAGNSVTIPGGQLVMNRDTDTLEARAIGVSGRGLQIEVDYPDSAGVNAPGFWFVVDSSAITLPGDLPDFIAGVVGDQDTATSFLEDLPPVFVAGRSYTITLGVSDLNYFDYVRSGNIPLSGRGFINHLEGGMGVFGSLATRANGLRVVGDVDDVREGTYWLSGTLMGTPVAVSLELYVRFAEQDSTDAAAFVTGNWVHGPIDRSADGLFRGDTLAITIYQRDSVSDSVSAFLVAGTTAPGATTTLTVFDRRLNVVGSVEIERPGGL